MFRKFLLPLAAAALLAGCVTSAPYGYRGEGHGDYYYGRPSVEYRHRGFHPGYGYGYGYGHPYYGPYRPGFYGYYGRPHGFYGGFGRSFYGYGYPHHGFGYPHHGHRHYRPVYRTHPGAPDNRPDGGGWRNFEELRRRRDGGTRPGGVGPSPGGVTRVEPRMPVDDGGSRMGEMVRRGRDGGRPVQED